MKKYLKLGELSSSFYDPTSRVGLAKDEVIEVTPGQLRSQRIKRFLKGGGLAIATENDYKAFINKSKIIPGTQDDGLSDDISGKSFNIDSPDIKVEDIHAHVKTLGWEKDDEEAALAITKKKELVKFVKETEQLYSEE